MLYTYNECMDRYKNDYQIKKALGSGKLRKVESGIYSDEEFELETAVISKKYPKAVFTMDSAFYYLGLTDTIPDKYHLVTDKDASKIRDGRVLQSFENHTILELGVTEREVDGVKLRMYSYERMLLELLRNKNKMSFDRYKEIIQNYRKRVDKMDITLLLDMAEEMPKSDMIIKALELEVL
ncbi:MAG: hypothetical protein K6F49_00895 [Saccharofermentans sp.]|nr:hypothetical protein [Saccharofermentans sp.]